MKKKFIVLFIVICSFCFADNQASEYNDDQVSFISFSTLLEGNSVVINWEISHQNKNLILYRSTHRFSSFFSLSNAIPIASIKDTGKPYLDYPIAGIPFYYAIVEENQIASGKITFIGGKNTSSIPIEVIESSDGKVSKKATTEMRSIPLPYLNLEKETQKKEAFFSSQTENLISVLTAGNENYQEFELSSLRREIYIFPDDKRSPRGGETMELQKVLNSSFQAQNWQKAQRELEDFLKIRRTTRVTARTEFYLAETLFFQDQYRAALMGFLKAESVYPNPSKEWIRYCLLELSKNSKN